jgi:hypothetical protein
LKLLVFLFLSLLDVIETCNELSLPLNKKCCGGVVYDTSNNDIGCCEDKIYETKNYGCCIGRSQNVEKGIQFDKKVKI